MADTSHKAPSIRETAFNCPHCGAYARQNWGISHALMVQGAYAPTDSPTHFGPMQMLSDCWVAFCERCNGISYWVGGRMVYPDVLTAPMPNPDLPDPIRDDYMEARGIADRSPRGAAALLRLCVQNICKHLGEPGKDINTDVGSLVKKGLPAQAQQALDIVRVVGNNAVHPGQIDLKDDRATASQLFALVNYISETMISQPKRLKELYDTLPQSSLEAIAKRDE